MTLDDSAAFASPQTQTQTQTPNLLVGAAVGLVVFMGIALAGHRLARGTFLPHSAAATPAPQVESAEPAQAPVPFSVRATVSNAVLILRGETSPLPYGASIPSSKMNEEIEIRAPGREGRRFWLKLDRPRTLVVTLPPGSGVIDATYEETEVALGQALARPERVTKPAAAAPQLGSNQGWRPTPRGGRGAVAATTEPAPTAPAVVAPVPTPVAPPPQAGHGRPELDRNPWDGK